MSSTIEDSSTTTTSYLSRLERSWRKRVALSGRQPSSRWSVSPSSRPTSPGASGQLYAQIKASAPYDVLLSADAERPEQLAREGLAIADTRFVYAQGKLVLWSAQPGLVAGQGAALKCAELGKVALADPKSAPYGVAAQQVLSQLGLWQKLNGQGKLVLGASVAQAFQFVESGNASCGFVALSQLLVGKQRGSRWQVPQALYTPLQQEAILLKSNKPAARKLLAWLRSDPQALRIIRAAGYATPAAR